MPSPHDAGSPSTKTRNAPPKKARTPRKERRRSNRRGVDRRHELLETIEDLVGFHGWEHINARALAQTLGISTGLFHHHFGSMEDLAVFLHEDAVQSLATRTRGIPEGPLAERCRAFMERTTHELEVLDGALVSAWAHSLREKRHLTSTTAVIEALVRRAIDVPRHARAAVAWLLELVHLRLVAQRHFGRRDDEVIEAFAKVGGELAALLASGSAATAVAVLERIALVCTVLVAQPRGTSTDRVLTRALRYGLENSRGTHPPSRVRGLA